MYCFLFLLDSLVLGMRGNLDPFVLTSAVLIRIWVRMGCVVGGHDWVSWGEVKRGVIRKYQILNGSVGWVVFFGIHQKDPFEFYMYCLPVSL